MSYYYYKKSGQKSPWCLFYDYVQLFIIAYLLRKMQEYWNSVGPFTITFSHPAIIYFVPTTGHCADMWVRVKYIHGL